MAKNPPRELDESEARQALTDMAGWSVKDGKLHRDYTFKDFVTAFGWMTSAAMVAEKMNHHPEWSNVYSKVTVALSTHEVDGLTERDLKLAGRMEELARRLGAE